MPFFHTSFLLYLVLFSVYLIILWHTPDRSPGPQDQQPVGEDRFAGIAIYLFVCWWIAFLFPFVTSPWSVLPVWLSAVVGTTLFVVGTIIRTVAIRTLGHFFTYQLCIREQHTMVQHGIYRYIRHPSYTGTLLEALGMLLVARSLYGLCLFSVSAAWLFFLRIRREEQMMIDHFGEVYRQYQARSWRLFPGIFGFMNIFLPQILLFAASCIIVVNDLLF